MMETAILLLTWIVAVLAVALFMWLLWLWLKKAGRDECLLTAGTALFGAILLALGHLQGYTLLAFPPWVTVLLIAIAGVMLVLAYFRRKKDSKSSN